MKIVLNHTQYKKLLKEDLGVSRTVISFTNLIFDILSLKVEEFLKTKEQQSGEIKITLDEISDIWSQDEENFIELPIETIRIEWECLLTPSGQYNTGFKTTGAAYQLLDNSLTDSYLMKPSSKIPSSIREEIDSTINAKFDFSVKINNDFDESNIQELFYDLTETISHEVNHMLEYFNRITVGAPPVNVAYTYSGEKNYNIPKNIFEVWKYFTQLLYFSEPQEINAMTQEMYNQRLRKPFEELKNHMYWDVAEELENFDSDAVISELVSRIKDWNPKLIVSVLNRLFKWFIIDYQKYIQRLGLTPSKSVMSTKNILELMRVLEPRINKAGKKLKRNFARLYSIEID